MRMRSHVRRLGTLSGMELPVDLFGELAADALDLRQVLDARADHALQPAEPRQQLPAALDADSGDALQGGSRAAPGAARTVAGDGEAVRLVADSLDQVQAGMVGRKPHRALADPQLLETRPSLRPLGDADQRDVGEARLRQRLFRRAHLPFAAVDEDQVRGDALPARDPAVAARERLRERPVIVAGRDALDVVAAVFAAAHVHAVVYHARRYRRLAHRMTDIETFDSLHRLRESQPFAQRGEPHPLSALLRETRLERLQRVLLRHLEPGAALGRGPREDAHAALRVRGEGRFELPGVELFADHDHGGHRSFQIMLSDERRKHFFRVALLRILRKEAAVAELPAAAHHHQVYAGQALFHGNRDDVDVDVVAGVGVQALAHLGERLDLVAVDRRFLVAPPFGGLLHARLDPLERGVAAALEVELRALDVLRVGFGADQSYAGRGAAADPLQQLDALAHCARVRKRSEVAVGLVHRAAVKAKARKLPAAHHQVGIGLVVAKEDVVARRERLDEIVLEDQGFGLGAGDRDLDVGDLRQHHRDTGPVLDLVEIGRDALFQVAGFADVKRLAVAADHAVYARHPGKRGEERAGVEGCRSWCAPGLFRPESCASWIHRAPRRKVAISRSTASNIGVVSRLVCVL